MIKGIIFDMDGTLIDTNQLVTECIQESVQKHLGYWPQAESFLEIMGKPLVVQMAFFDEELVDEMVESYREIYRERMDSMTELFPGVEESLKTLHEKGVRMGILTNKGRRGLSHALDKFEILEYFDPALSVADVTLKKPDPEGALRIINEWGFTPEETLFVGDSPNDILCANRAGIPAVLVGWTILPESHFESMTVDFVVEHMSQIETLVSKTDQI